MAEGDAQWELCKENIQPLRSGRAVSALHQALSQQDGSGYAAVQQQKQAFESELRLYSGDDPLDVWDRYIRWTQQTFPQGGKESNLLVLLERAVKHFVEEDRYYNDLRYVSLWIKLAENSSEPLDIYSYMHNQGIGLGHATLYIAWAEELERRGNSKKADSVYQNGLRCGAEPADRLHQFHRGFQARVSRQVMETMMAGEQEADSPEPAVPERASLVDLKHRGKKMAIAPIIRTGAAAGHRSRGLNLQLPAAPQNNQRVLVYDENKPSAPELSEPRPEPWMAPPTSTEKENELMPEKWTNVKMPQKSRLGHSVVPLPSRPNFQPFVEESDQPPVVTPCKINPAVNTVLSARKPSREETALERLQEQQEQQQAADGQAREQSMYCKELLFSGAAEFSLEELRAERYNKRVAQRLEEMEEKLKMEKENLRKQIEEKKKLLKENVQAGPSSATSSTTQLAGPQPTPAFPPTLGSVTGVKVHDEADCSARFDVTVQDDFESDKNSEGLKVMCFAVLDESSITGNPQEIPPVSGPSGPSARRPLSTIIKPLVGSPSARLKSITTDELSEDAIVDSCQNITLCPAPDHTCDFVRAARLASTPLNGGQHPEATAQTPMAYRTGFEASQPVVKLLSTIEEATVEDSHRSTLSASTLGNLSCSKALHLSNTMAMCSLELSHGLQEQMTQDTVMDAEVEDPCGALSRLRVLDKVDLASLPGFHRETTPLPEVEKSDIFTGEGEETVIILSPITSGRSFRVHFGQTRCEENVIFKVDFETVPWDFYIASQMRTRLDTDSSKYFGSQSSCFVYANGCVTITHGQYQCTLQDIVAKRILPCLVALLTLELLEMVLQMHSCHVVHGGIRPEALLLRFSMKRADGDGLLKILDFTSSVDLDMQPEVTSVGCLPSAQDLIRQGLLSHTSSPYQIDLYGIAATVYTLLEKRQMKLVKDGSEWKLAADLEAVGELHRLVWQEFFQKILNPGCQSTVAVLSELQKLIKDCFGHRATELDSFWMSGCF